MENLLKKCVGFPAESLVRSISFAPLPPLPLRAVLQSTDEPARNRPESPGALRHISSKKHRSFQGFRVTDKFLHVRLVVLGQAGDVRGAGSVAELALDAFDTRFVRQGVLPLKPFGLFRNDRHCQARERLKKW